MLRRLILNLFLVGVSGLWLYSCTPRTVDTYTDVQRDPNVSPDSFGTTIPPNIAPLNFRILEPGRSYLAKIRAAEGDTISVASATGAIEIPAGSWRSLLRANQGKPIFIDVYVQGREGKWTKFRPLTNMIAAEPIDPIQVFRLTKPIYNWWKEIGIYQRHLGDYRRSVMLHGRSFGQGCLNCHSFVGNDPGRFTIGLRSAEYGSATLLARAGNVEKIGSKWGYTA